MKIDNFKLGRKPFVIAELSANHGNNIQIAIDTIKAAKRAGADAVKLQTYTPDTMTLDSKKNYFTDVLNGTVWEGRTLYDLYKEANTPWEWHKELFKVAKEEGLICFSSPFDKTAVDFLEQFNPPAYKIASFEIQDIPLIEYTASKGKPMIISTGIAKLDDIQLAVETCRNVGNNQIAILKCTSSYPAPLEEANLETIRDIKKRFGVEAGLSDHTLGIVAPVVAVSFGASIIEKHFILKKSIGGPDASFSMDEMEFRKMVTAVHQASVAIGQTTYDLTNKAIENRKFARSLFVVIDIKEGELFTNENVKSIRPSFGLPPKMIKQVIGKVAAKNIEKGTPLSTELIKNGITTK